ncbi:hypothetical protein PHLGIDRAFT_479839 [Phlebiopsis gigantea 11061_1 CR5-6]|uniref:DUF6534 domain-containing protein n=1 Tax=Phlebiopsis gigantea (strain 11061_1 CR5-6) TaxID=745531 RepID=A0A0C3NLQ2_PHLG1|nr:hypothetical protein PHLGIDRAFT_479839 [Phlebiopsis gigantea 11061_1 CR5-6]
MNTTTPNVAFSSEAFLSPLIDLLCIEFILFGMFVAQAHTYWTSYHDTWGIRTMVLAICVFETVHTVFAIILLHTYYEDSTAAKLPVIWSAKAIILVKVVTIGIAEGFTLYRIQKLNPRARYLALVPTFLIISGIVLGVAVSIRFSDSCLQAHFWEDLAGDTTTRDLLYAVFSATVAADVCNAGLLIYFLQQHRSAFRRTHHFVQKVVFYAANTGTLTAVFSIATLITFRMETREATYIGMIEILSKMYANAMITMLNARRPHMETRAIVNETNAIPMANRPVTPRVCFALLG